MIRGTRLQILLSSLLLACIIGGAWVLASRPAAGPPPVDLAVTIAPGGPRTGSPRLPAQPGTATRSTPTPTNQRGASTTTADASPTSDPDIPCGLFVFESTHPNVTMSARSATLIVVGTVQQVYPARWDTSDGQRPATCPRPANSIFTPVRITIEQVLKGPTGQQEVLVYAFGGAIGRDRMQIGDPADQRYRFFPGEHVLVLLIDGVPSQTELKAINGEPLNLLLDRFTLLPTGQATSDTRTIPYQQLLDEIAQSQQSP